MKIVAALSVLLMLAGCSAPRSVVLPPEIIKVSVFMPLPADCGALQPVVLPPGSSANDVMLQLKKAVDSYNDQVSRCFGVSNP